MNLPSRANWTLPPSANFSPLRLAILAPLVAPIAPPFWGGAQVIVAELARGLAARGHQVTLYASDESNVPGVTLRPLGIPPQPLATADFTATSSPSPNTGEIFFRQGQAFLQIWQDIQTQGFDLVHAHAFDWPVFAFGALSAVPVVHTLHLPAVDPAINALLKQLAGTERHAAGLATVSHACATSYHPYVPRMGVVYNGLPLAEIPFDPEGGDYLIFVGRISPEKGLAAALEIARLAGRRLVILGAIYDQNYYRRVLAPVLADPLVDYRGVCPREEVYRLLGGARALLFPAAWDEPFGLVPLEALAAGTPVVAFARGALPEIVEDGLTGFLLRPNDVVGAVAALNDLPHIKRLVCRERALARFDLPLMLEEYEQLYRKVIQVW